MNDATLLEEFSVVAATLQPSHEFTTLKEFET